MMRKAGTQGFLRTLALAFAISWAAAAGAQEPKIFDTPLGEDVMCAAATVEIPEGDTRNWDATPQRPAELNDSCIPPQLVPWRQG
jgi:hypothetical protein